MCTRLSLFAPLPPQEWMREPEDEATGYMYYPIHFSVTIVWHNTCSRLKMYCEQLVKNCLVALFSYDTSAHDWLISNRYTMPTRDLSYALGIIDYCFVYSR